METMQLNLDKLYQISTIELMNEESIANLRRKYWKPVDELEDVREFVEERGEFDELD